MAADRMAERERAPTPHLTTLQGGFLLLAIGALFGAVPPLSRLASFAGAHPLALSFYVNLLCTPLFLTIGLARAGLPRLGPQAWPFLATASLTGMASQLLLFWSSANLDASLVSMILVTEGLIVFLLAAVIGIEAASLKRLVGLVVGIAGIGLLLADGASGMRSSWIWIIVALGVPACYAVEGVMLAVRRPAQIDVFMLVGLWMLLAALLTAPLVALFDDFRLVDLDGHVLGPLATAAAMSIATGLANVLLIVLVTMTGPVFASQNSYAIMLCGVAWSLVLLSEGISTRMWAALVLLCLGLVIVGPKSEAARPLPLPR